MVEHDGAAQVADTTAGYVVDGPTQSRPCPDRNGMADLALRAAGIIGKEPARGLFAPKHRKRRC